MCFLVKLSNNYILSTVAGKNIVVPVGTEASSNKMLTLNDTGVFFWNMLKNGTTKEKMLEAVLREYEVSADEASRDIDEFIARLIQAKILED